MPPPACRPVWSPTTLYLLAESIFAYIDVLSAESAEGYALEQSAAASEAELRRRRLVRMLVRDPPAEPGGGRGARPPTPAGRCRGRLAVLAIAGEQRAAPRPRGCPPGTISEAIGELTCALVADPDGPGPPGGDRAAVPAPGARAGLGTTVDWTAGPDQLRARPGRARARPDARAAGRWSRARERAGELLLRSDPRLAAELAADRLAPLDGLSAGLARAADRDAAGVAGRAGPAGPGRRSGSAIHPQTARYRLGRLRELFGDALDDPDERFWLELALRVADARRAPGEAADGRRLRRRSAARGCGLGVGLGLGAVGTWGPSAPAAISSGQA